MNTTSELKAFPPVDDFVAFVATVDWKAVYNKFIIITATIAAVAVVLPFVAEETVANALFIALWSDSQPCTN